MKSVKKIHNLKNKRVLLRVDFNVPIKKGKVLDDLRLQSHLPTIQYLIKKGAKVLLLTHLGRPKGKVVASLKVDPVVEELGKLLKKKVKKIETGNYKLGEKKKLEIEKKIKAMKPGQVAIFENVRFSPDEKKNTGTLAKDLASLADIFVLDGFAVAHRPAASVMGVVEYLPGYAGFLLEGEVKALQKIIKKPKHPSVVALGGAKTETKIPVLKNLLSTADKILIGGGVVNTYLKAKGYKVGDSLVDMDVKKDALMYCKKKKVILPVDVVVGDWKGENYRLVDLKKTPHQVCKKGEAILDIGPKTIQLFAKHIKSAQTLVWNGAMGYFEQPPYHVGTMAMARLVASRSKGKAFGIIGGGETIQTMKMVNMLEHIDFVSTGGGAMLEFLAGKELPGIKALK